MAPRTQPIELKIEQERQHSPTRNCTKSGLDPCRFSPDMIKTSFTLFFLTKTTYKSHFQRRKACDSIRPHLPSIPSHFLESLSYKILKYRHCLPVPLIFRTVNFFFSHYGPLAALLRPNKGILNLNVDCKDECYICYCPWAINLWPAGGPVAPQ